MDSNADIKVKSFWERKEGFTGMVFGVGALVAVAMGLYSVLPKLIVLLENIWIAGALGGGLFLLIMFFLNRQNRILLGAMYQSLMRLITSIFVTIDPIGIIENYIRSLKKKIENINEELANLKAQIANVTNVINKARKDQIEALNLAKQAEKQNKPNDAALNAKEAKRQKDFADNMQTILDKMNFLYRFLDKIEQNSQTILTDTINEVNAKKKEREMWKATSSAIKSAQSIILGDPDQRALFDASMEEVANDINAKVGEMDRFVDRTKAIMSNIDLKNGMLQDEGLKLLEDWENDNSSILISNKEKKQILSQVGSSATADAEEEVTVRRR